jgi:uncharacterized membrane protein
MFIGFVLVLFTIGLICDFVRTYHLIRKAERDNQ